MSLPLSFSESSTILSFFLSRPLPILLCPESTHHFSALSTPCKHDDGGGDDDGNGGGGLFGSAIFGSGSIESHSKNGYETITEDFFRE